MKKSVRKGETSMSIKGITRTCKKEKVKENNNACQKIKDKTRANLIKGVGKTIMVFERRARIPKLTCIHNILDAIQIKNCAGNE